MPISISLLAKYTCTEGIRINHKRGSKGKFPWRRPFGGLLADVRSIQGKKGLQDVRSLSQIGIRFRIDEETVPIIIQIQETNNYQIPTL